MGLFGTNGVRGVFGSGITARSAHDLAAAVAACLGPGPVLVGRDGRRSSQALEAAACAGLMGAGRDCARAGLVPTPCLQYAVRELGYAGGLMVTASHNPPEYGGIKPVAANGVELPREGERAVEAAYAAGAGAAPAAPARWGSPSVEARAAGAYAGGVASRVDAAAIARRRPRVVVDAGNGAQAEAAPAILRSLGCEVSVINGAVDGGFPGRGPEPMPENLGGLSRAVRAAGADMGVAFDGDGDRSVFCDERGRALAGDRSALVLASHALASSPGSAVATCVNSGSAVEEVAGRHGARVVRTRVGSVEVSHAMIREGALVGYEENGGFMYGPHNQVRDGAMAAALALDALAASGSALSELAAALPPSHTGKRKVACPPGRAAGLLEEVLREHPGADTTDGVKAPLGPRSWVMVRPSGTEPAVRVYAEAGSEAELVRVLDEYEARVGEILGRAPARGLPRRQQAHRAAEELRERLEPARATYLKAPPAPAARQAPAWRI